jgi:hypothetical protein
MLCQNLRSVPLTCTGFLQFVALDSVVNGTKIFAAFIIRMEMNMVKINFPYTGHECRGIVEVIQHSFLTLDRNEVSGQPHATAASFPAKKLLVPFKLEDEWTPEPF